MGMEGYGMGGGDTVAVPWKASLPIWDGGGIRKAVGPPRDEGTYGGIAQGGVSSPSHGDGTWKACMVSSPSRGGEAA